MGSKKSKFGLMDNLINELLSTQSEEVVDPKLLANDKLASRIPLRYRIIADRFPNCLVQLTGITSRERAVYSDAA